MPGAEKLPYWKSVHAVFLLALLLRLFFAAGGLAHPEENRFSRPDTPTFLAPSRSLLENGEYRSAEGHLTAYRTPGFPVLLMCLRPFGDESKLFPLVLILLGSLTVFPVYFACRKLAPPGASALSALLFALNPTAIANAPLLLSDTFFALFAALTLYFFLTFAYGEKHDVFYLGCAVFCGAFAALIRPVNLLWIVPFAAALFFVRDLRVKRKAVHALCSVAMFALILFPWIARNHAVGAGWRLDSNSAVTLLHNASGLEAALSRRPADLIHEEYLEHFEAVFRADRARFSSECARLDYSEKYLTGIILAHPVKYAVLSVRPVTLAPDIPALLENLGVTQSGRGTLDVLNRQGFFAAVKFYFEGRAAALAASIPLILASLILYFAALAGLVIVIRRKDWLMTFLFFGLGMYYVWITGPVSMPRYQLPALPVFCVLAAICFDSLLRRKQPAEAGA